MALQRQTVSIPVAGGLDTKTDPFQAQLGSSLGLENARFQKTGKLSKRFGQFALTTASSDGQFSSSTIRSLINDDQFLSAITSNGVYAYSSGDNKWTKQSNLSLSSKIETDFISKCQFNQRWPDFDVTPDGTHKVYICAQDLSTSSFNSSILIVLQDVKTGFKKTATINLLTTSKVRGGRVVIVKNNGQLLTHVYYFDGSTVKRNIYDENLDIVGSPFTVIASSGIGAQFDICKDNTRVYFAHLLGSNLNIRTFSFVGSIINSNTINVANPLGLTAGIVNPIGPVYDLIGRSLSVTTTSNHFHVAWIGSSTGVIRGFLKDLNNSISETTFNAQPVKLSICSNGEFIEILSDSERVSTDNCITSYIRASFTSSYSVSLPIEINRMCISSQPFVVFDKLFVITRCNEQLNKNYYLYNVTDQYVTQVFSNGMASQQTVNGLSVDMMVSKTVVLNNVAESCINRLYVFNQDKIDTISGICSNIHDFNITKDDGTKFRIGKSIYHINGQLIECDKLYSYENSFNIIPQVTLSESTSGGSANPDIASKNFKYKIAYEYYSATGERTISAFSTVASISTTAAARWINLAIKTPVLSLKNRLTINNFNQPVALAVYRTTNNGSTFYRCLTFVTSFNNGDVTTISDTTVDSQISNNEIAYTTGAANDVLENDTPPCAKYGVSGGNRIFLAGLEEKDEIAYSKKQLYGQSVWFSNLFRIRVSTGTNSDRSKISGLGYMDGKLIIFREQSIYFIQGDGPNEIGIGDFTEPEIIQSDVGCTDARSVLSMPSGLMFKSRKGIYLLTRGLSVEYIGAPVEAYNSESIIASILSDKYNECRFYTSTGKCLVYNYVFNTWAIFTNQASVDADTWMGNPIIVRNNKIYTELDTLFTDDGAFQSMKFISPWIKFDLIQGYIRTYQLWILGTYKSAHTLKCRVYWDYNDATFEDYSLVYNGTDSPQYQFQISLPVQKVESIKFEIFDTNQSGTGESYDLSNIQIEVGIKAGGYKLAASKSY